MHALTLIIVTLLLLAIAYKFYAKFIITMAGAVHGIVVLFASARLSGLSLIHLAKQHIADNALLHTAFK